MASTAPWILITQADAMYHMVPDQRALILEANQNGEDPFGHLSADVIAEVRTAIISNPANQLSSVQLAVPPELVGVTTLLIIEAMGPWFSNGTPLTPLQTKMIEKAEKILERVSNWKLEQRTMNGGGFYISQPDDPEVSAQGARPSAALVDSAGLENSRTRLFTRESLAGL